MTRFDVSFATTTFERSATWKETKWMAARTKMGGCGPGDPQSTLISTPASLIGRRFIDRWHPVAGKLTAAIDTFPFPIVVPSKLFFFFNLGFVSIWFELISKLNGNESALSLGFLFRPMEDGASDWLDGAVLAYFYTRNQLDVLIDDRPAWNKLQLNKTQSNPIKPNQTH